MNPHLATSLKAVKLHGAPVVYYVKGTASFNIETGQVTSTDQTINIQAIPKPIRANQYNYPDLIGKETTMLYVVNHQLTFTPSVNDKFAIGSDTFIVQSIIKHYARGDLVLYKLIAVKG